MLQRSHMKVLRQDQESLPTDIMHVAMKKT